MSKACKVIIEPDGTALTAPEGTILSKLLAAGDIHLETPCGGAGKCGKCRVIATGGLSPLSQAEAAALSPREQQENYRLACCTAITGDAVIYIPEASRSLQQQILTKTADVDIEPSPAIRKHYAALAVPELGEEKSEEERLLDSCGAASTAPGLLPSLAQTLRDSEYSVTAVIHKNTVISLEPGNTEACCYGAAFDIGSTTLAGYLTDLNTGRLVATGSVMNPQILFGDDLISRINYIGRDNDRLFALQSALWNSLSAMTASMAEEAGISTDCIYTASAVGNTCMCHIAMGISPFTLGTSPYIPVTSKAAELPASELGLKINPAGVVQFLPSIAGFVGADTTAVILSEMPPTDKTVMAVDIGTNGEIALWHKEKLSVCSAAAGPAFEGAGISCGMRGGAGAIDKVYMQNGRLVCHVCGDTAAKGICGSGLVDAVRVLLAEEAIDMTGRLLPPDEFTGNANIAARLINGEKGPEFILAAADESMTGYPITLKHSDIRALQLAKGSICAAIRTLLAENGISEYDLSALFIAGGFGNYLDKSSACAIGLLPQIDTDLIIPVGNAAGTGARRVLLSQKELEKAGEIAASAKHYELALSPKYQINLMDAMMFY